MNKQQEEILRILNSHARFITDANGESVSVIRQGHFPRVASEIAASRDGEVEGLKKELHNEREKYHKIFTGMGQSIDEQLAEIERLRQLLKSKIKPAEG